jgi:chromosome segregation ATPase
MEADDSEGPAEHRANSAVPDASFDGDALLRLERQLSALLAAQTERDQRLTQLTDELRERADRLLVQTSLVEQKDSELADMRAKLDESLLSHHSHDQQVRTLEQALQKATSLTAEADERSQRAYEQIGKYEAELAAVRLRLADAENDWPKSKRGADALRARTTAGLASKNDRNTPESASLRSNDKNSELIQFRNEGLTGWF